VGNATFALDNGGLNPRPITLVNNGGGLAATAGHILTVDGLVGSAAGVGPLIIGIPASAANGNVAGLVPGSGTGTANTTPVYATGTVVLNNTAGNYFYGGAVITGGATLNINGNYALGGANYLGGLVINNGTLQYNTALNSSADISQSSGGVVQKVTIAGAATIDLNGNTVVYANSVGNGGSGALTVTNSGSPGVGGLFLNGGNSYTGGTTVDSGAVLGGASTIAGNVTWNSGSYAALSRSAPLTVSGAVTLINPTVQVIAAGLTTGTYTLLTAAGGITGGSSVNPVPAGTGSIAAGYAGTVSISGNTVVLTVIQLGVAATWTDGLGDQNWSEGGNWTGGFAPQNPGDAATFGTGGLGSPVNLNQNETAGALTFNNAASYTITGASTLTLDNKTKGVAINVTAGTTNAINTALSLNDNVTATVNSGESLALGGTIANQSNPETVTVTGGGTLAVSGANSYGPAAGTVGTTLSGAALQVGNNTALGAGDVNVTANSTLSAGTAGLSLANNFAVAAGHTVTVANNGNTLTLGGVVSGNGALTAAGAGTLVLGNANNTYAGVTALNAGLVAISAEGAAPGNPGNLGVVPAAVTPNNVLFNGGDLLATTTLSLQANRGLGIGSVSAANTATTTAFMDAAAAQTLTISGVIASAGNAGLNNLTVNSQAGSTGMVVLGGANTFNGTNVISAGTEQLANSLALQDSTLFYNNQGGVLDFGTLTAATLGGLLGAENLILNNDSAAAVALTIANNGNPVLYTGTLSDNGAGASLTLNGAGSQQIGSGGIGGAVYTGATTLNRGTLILGGNTALSGALNLTGLNGACSLTAQDSAAISASAAVVLASAGGSAYPGVCTLTLTGNATLSAPSLGFGAGASRVPTGCFVTVAGNATLNIAGDFELEDSEGSTPENNAVNLNGGTLAVGNFTLTYATAGTHQATFNFNGGVLSANASDPSGSTFLPALTALTVNVTTNGALITPNNNSITIAATLAGAGGLTNFGPGTLNLSGANTYAGVTEVSNNATLNVINPAGSATGTNTVVVFSGGTLEGTGAIAGNVIWQPGALAVFNAGSTPAPLTVGAVTLNNNTVTVNVPGSTPLPIGVYRLMNYTAAGSSGAFNPAPVFTGAGVASGVQSTISTSGGAVVLTVAPNVVYNVWDVDASGNWTTAANWSANPTVPGNPGDAALLGVGTAERTVTLNANESLGYLTLSNANSFVIAGAGHALTLDNSGSGAFVTVSGGVSNVIQTAVNLNDNATVTVYSGDSLAVSGIVANSPNATETLALSGSGTLTLGGANTYGPAPGSTGTTLNGGILQVGNNHALSTGDVNVAGNSTLQAGAAGLNLTNNFNLASGVTVTLNDNGNAFTLGGTFNGSGGVVKIGAGTVSLTNNNGFASALIVSNGTLVLASNGSGGSGPITNDATLQLADAGAVNNVLALNSGSTLQLRADTSTTFSTGGLVPQNASDTLNFDVGPVTSGVSGNTLTLSGALAFADSQVNQTINVTGTNGYTLALGDLSAISATSHNPYQMVNINVVPGISAQISSFTCGNWGDFLDFSGGGNAIVTGNLANTSNGSVVLCVNGGATVTLQGSSVKSAAGDAYRYLVQSGVLVADNSGALINDTTGAGLNTSYFILGPATNVVTAGASSLPTGFQTVNTNNSVNCAFYLGDANNPSGGLTLAATVTNNVSDGDVGFTNSGVMTIGGQNTSGVNTFANNIILGWTPNAGKSVTLVAATGGEVDFTGGILANGTDTTAGITVGNPAFAGLVKLTGTNTYHGPTLISNGTLALANYNGYDAYLGNSGSIVINAGAILDVTGQTSGTLPLGTGAIAQTLQGSGTLNGTLTVGSLGTVAPGSPTATGVLTVNTSATLGGATVMKLNNAGSPASDKLASPAITAGGTLTVTNLGPALSVGQTFHLFNSAVSGFAQVNLPLTDQNNYKYTWNNQLANNGTIVVATAVPSVNTNAATAYFQAAVTSNGSLKFTWAPDHQGWQLYTNAVGLTASGSWFPVAGSAAVTNETIPVNPANPKVFFQLRYP
jgi:autotransporter-associated beta strand protein